MPTANIYKKGRIVDSFEYPEPTQANRNKELVGVIKNGIKIGRVWWGVDFARFVISQLPMNYNLETLAMMYSGSCPDCFWVVLEDGSWGK